MNVKDSVNIIQRQNSKNGYYQKAKDLNLMPNTVAFVIPREDITNYKYYLYKYFYKLNLEKGAVSDFISLQMRNTFNLKGKK